MLIATSGFYFIYANYYIKQSRKATITSNITVLLIREIQESRKKHSAILKRIKIGEIRKPQHPVQKASLSSAKYRRIPDTKNKKNKNIT